mgnify:CR=1 FL=1
MMWLFGFAVLGIIISATFFILDAQKKSENRNRALALIGAEPAQKSGKTEEKNKAVRDDIAKKLRSAGSVAKAAHNKKSIALLLTQANMKISVTQFWIISAVTSAALGGMGDLLSDKPVLPLLLAVIGMLGLPRMIVKMAGQKRQKAFLGDFSDALEAMARLLKAGMPVGEAIAMCAREYTGPVGEEMRRMYDAQKVGVPLSDAALEATHRMPVPEMRMLATALVIQQQTGSSLSEVLENLAGMIRARFRLKRKIQALSSEAKVSAMIIGALPIFVTLALKAVNPEYIDLLFLPGLGQILLWGAITWMSLGILVMRQMINFKI